MASLKPPRRAIHACARLTSNCLPGAHPGVIALQQPRPRPPAVVPIIESYRHSGELGLGLGWQLQLSPTPLLTLTHRQHAVALARRPPPHGHLHVRLVLGVWVVLGPLGELLGDDELAHGDLWACVRGEMGGGAGGGSG